MKDTKNYAAYIAAPLIFGANGVAVRHVPLSSGMIALARTLVGGLFLFLLMAARRSLPRRDTLKATWLPLLIAGVCLGLNWMLLFEGYRYASVSVATLVYYCAPMLVLLVSPLLFRERLRIGVIIGAVAVAAGMLLITGTRGEGPDFIRGVLCAFASALLYACLVISARFVRGIDGMQCTFFQLTAAAAVLLPYNLLRGERFILSMPPSGWLALLFLCLVSTGLAYTLYFTAIRALPAQTVALFSYVDPLSALLFSALLLSERLTFIQLIGAMLILGGAAFGEAMRGRAGTEGR